MAFSSYFAIILYMLASTSTESSVLRLLTRTILPASPAIIQEDYKLDVPLENEYSNGSGRNDELPGKRIEIFFRRLSDSNCQNRDCLLFLQGGPGFPASLPSYPLSGWMSRAIKDFDIILLDQRGTGLSTPVTQKTLTKEFPNSPVKQAEYLLNFRADSIVRDCELLRKCLGLSKWGAVLGQSFGGFCLTTYLSFFPSAIKLGMFTGGLPPLHAPHPDDVYRATYASCVVRNKRYFLRYPHDADLMKSVLRYLQRNVVVLPRSGVLTTERFQQLGLLLGMKGGYERLHYLLETSFVEGPESLSYIFLKEVEDMQDDFDTHPIYALLHEAIYCENGITSDWSADRIRHDPAFFSLFDPNRACDTNDTEPVYFTGEMVYRDMFTSGAFPKLSDLKEVAEIIAANKVWSSLYDRAVLKTCDVPCAAVVYGEDMYVDRSLSLRLADDIPSLKVWLTNELVHSGIRDDGYRVID
eukprot:gene4009-7986_t